MSNGLHFLCTRWTGTIFSDWCPVKRTTNTKAPATFVTSEIIKKLLWNFHFQKWTLLPTIPLKHTIFSKSVAAFKIIPYFYALERSERKFGDKIGPSWTSVRWKNTHIQFFEYSCVPSIDDTNSQDKFSLPLSSPLAPSALLHNIFRSRNASNRSGHIIFAVNELKLCTRPSFSSTKYSIVALFFRTAVKKSGRQH